MKAILTFMIGATIGWLVAQRRRVVPAPVTTWTSADGTTVVTWSVMS